MEMFNNKVLKERLGHLKKSKVLKALEPVEKYAIKKCKQYGIEHSYDVIAQEVPYFKTMGYTEYGTCFIFQPLNLDMRSQQMRDALNDEVNSSIMDYTSYFNGVLEIRQNNKYQDRKQDFDKYPARDYIVVLPGSNKLKEKTCLNKLKYIAEKHGQNVWFKPHPITTYAVIGEIKDLFGANNVLPRDIDLYYYLPKAKKVYTTHISESALYAVAAGIPIEPVDVHNHIENGSFYSINRFLFEYQKHGKHFINKAFTSPKSGIINPAVDKEWRGKIDAYFDYITTRRNLFKDWYIVKPKNGK